MPQPTSSDVHLDAILTNVSIAFIQEQDSIIGHRVFAQVPVDKQSDRYYVFDRNDFNRDEAELRAPHTESAGGGFRLSRDGYYCDVYAFHQDLSNQTLRNADNPLDLQEAATRFVTNKLMIRQETQWVSDYFTTGVWDSDVTPTNLWDNYTTSDPIADVKAGKKAVLLASGFEPNVLVLGYEVFQALQDHPDFVDRIKYTSSESITKAIMARLIGVDRIEVAKAVIATNVEAEPESYALTHGKHALLTYSNPNPGLMMPSAGYTFTWTGVSQGFGAGIGVARFPMRHLDSERIEGQIAWDYKVVAPSLGYFISGAVS